MVTLSNWWYTHVHTFSASLVTITGESVVKISLDERVKIAEKWEKVDGLYKLSCTPRVHEIPIVYLSESSVSPNSTPLKKQKFGNEACKSGQFLDTRWKRSL